MKRDPLIPLNRRLNILKMLHGKELRTAEITEAYGVDDRTIRTDLETLRDGLEVMGTTVKIVEQRSGHSNLSYKSTVHPIFLALNLSEVFALLKALEQAAQGIMTGDVYRNIFNNVYCQLSDYAKKMLDGKLELGIKSADQKVTNRLEEEMVDKSEDYKLIYLEKSGRFFPIIYTDRDGKVKEEEVSLVDIRGEELKLEFKNKSGCIWVNYGDV